MLFIFEKKSWNWSFVFYLFATYVVYQILGNFWARYAHLINHRNIHDEYFTVVLSNGQPTFLSTILSFVLPVIIDPVFEETLDRGYFMNTFFPKSKYYLDVILSGLIFGLSHLILSHRDPISLLYYSLIGFFLLFFCYKLAEQSIDKTGRFLIGEVLCKLDSFINSNQLRSVK